MNKKDDHSKFPPAETGNASNPGRNQSEKPENSQLLDKKAEIYLRESGNIEDLPNAGEEHPEKNNSPE